MFLGLKKYGNKEKFHGTTTTDILQYFLFSTLYLFHFFLEDFIYQREKAQAYEGGVEGKNRKQTPCSVRSRT